MSTTLQFKRGKDAGVADLYKTAVAPIGEPIFATDTCKLYIATGETNDDGSPKYAIFTSDKTLAAASVTSISISADKHLIATLSDKTTIDCGAIIGVPAGGKKGQVLVKKTDTDFDVNWQDNAGVQGIFGGEFSTKKDLLAYTDATVGYSYIVTTDEDHDNLRTYYTLLQGKIWQYMGTFSDESSTVQGSNYFTRQWNSQGDVKANDTKVLSIPYTDTFTIIAPEVWFYETGEENIVRTVSEFDSGSSAAFAYDERYVEFVGTGTGTGSQMRLKTQYTFPFVKDTTWTADGQYSECEIDLSQFKTVESITVE